MSASTAPSANSSAAPSSAGLQHVAFIMDGNGRWASRRGFARLKGHAAGIETVKSTIEHLSDLGVPCATFYAFSTENWKRSLEEVSGLFNLMRQWFRKELNDIIEKGIRVRFIGNREDGKLAADILQLMTEVESKTAHNTKITAVFAINYSGRDELLRATEMLARSGQAATPENLSACLDTAGLPDPDLVIRTSGEQRLSGFLLWQSAHSEYWFCEAFWPDFRRVDFLRALRDYAARHRRYGE